MGKLEFAESGSGRGAEGGDMGAKSGTSCIKEAINLYRKCPIRCELMAVNERCLFRAKTLAPNPNKAQNEKSPANNLSTSTTMCSTVYAVSLRLHGISFVSNARNMTKDICRGRRRVRRNARCKWNEKNANPRNHIECVACKSAQINGALNLDKQSSFLKIVFMLAAPTRK